MHEEDKPFHFNFCFAQQSEPQDNCRNEQQIEDQCHAAEEITISPEGHTAPGAVEAVQLEGGIQLHKGLLPGNAASDLLRDSGLADSDLIPGRYEGGFKLWECAVDLANFLCKHFDVKSLRDGTPAAKASLKGTTVLELGCGQGLPGILLLLCGASVHFHDYNTEVLTALTAPNVAANLAASSTGSHEPITSSEARYFSGSWAALPGLLGREGLLRSYDIVLSAETIYSVDSQRQLLVCIKQCLKPGTGRAWIAAKLYYFGVGGGTASFRRLLAEDGTFEAGVVAVHDDGTSNKREILLLTSRAKC